MVCVHILMWLANNDNCFEKKKSHPCRPGDGLVLFSRTWCSSIKWTQFHKTSTLDKAMLWSSRTQTKTRPLCNHVWAQTKHEGCPSHKLPNISLSWLICMTCCIFTNYSFNLDLVCRTSRKDVLIVIPNHRVIPTSWEHPDRRWALFPKAFPQILLTQAELWKKFSLMPYHWATSQFSSGFIPQAAFSLPATTN